jgi:hypothetical protein
MISALLAALIGGEVVAGVLAAVGITGRAATAVRIGAAVARNVGPAVIEGVRKLQARADLTPEEKAVVAHVRARDMRDLAGPMDFP